MATVKQTICALKLKFLWISLVFMATSCANYPVKLVDPTEPPQKETLKIDELAELKPATQKPIIAIYSGAFTDLTGQRKSNSEFALFSSAVTAGPEAYLIRALKHAAKGEFFRVVERVGIDFITKERQIIRSTRESFAQKQKLGPLLFAGLLMQGGVIDYETNLKTGGMGARSLGIGASRQYREDVVTVSLRTVSVNTGEILIEVLVTKKILSIAVSTDYFKFIEMGTELVEVEVGSATNESMAIALQKAIETAVLETVYEGKTKGFWAFTSGD
ncbi:MAG: hypothetical protein CBB97_22120 [Candidatus Endolissoclinum sp. TMED37]|nr:MAG: hypothetical protein CBB97_22120 [Candidatus Endolissoclinum sp. TMED37]